MKTIGFAVAILSLLFTTSCQNNAPSASEGKSAIPPATYPKGTFGYDLQFLSKYHKDLILLGDDPQGAQVIVLPAYQGRVMTSTAAGMTGASFGWVNHELIASGQPSEHFNAFGGEERLWLGPEGGQFSIFFKKGVDFTFDNWFVPKEIDTEPFRLVSATTAEAHFEKDMHLENYSGVQLDLLVKRSIRLLDNPAIDSLLGAPVPPDVQAVAFESDNALTNTGNNAWNKQTGMLSIWILSMLNASDQTTVAVPYKTGDAGKLGKVVTDDYFGKVPAGRLKVENGLMLFKSDANYRSKIGISPARALSVIGSYDALNNVLTIAQFTLPEGARDYVNSLWKHQDAPFSGDAVNAYNDGPIDGVQMGKFYELESSSPAAALAPGQSIRHVHRTLHLKGNKDFLNTISVKLLGASLDKIAL